MIALTICAVGRLRGGAELELVQDYCARATRTGRALGVGAVTVTEVEDKKSLGMAEEARLIRAAMPAGGIIAALDERGRAMTSPEFAQKIAALRDAGHRQVSFVIGGADGIDPGLRTEADFSLSLGKMVWPHMLARVMLAEQIYRATTILAGAPYHRS